MLTPLQEQVAAIVAGLAEAEGFALAGGAALIARGDIERETRDLDFFRGSRRTPSIALCPPSSTELDLGADAGLFPGEPRRPAPTPSGEELAVDKVLAVFGRAEARDFVDLAAIEPRDGLERLFELAAGKDRGFTPEMLAETAGRLSRLRPGELGLDRQQYEQLELKVLERQERARNG